MPNYDFKCDVCHQHMETNVASTVTRLPCPFCDPSPRYTAPKTSMRRQPSAPAFTVKGFNAKNGYSK